MIHLDTNFLVKSLVPMSPEGQRIDRWLSKHVPLATSAVSWAEFLFGPVDSKLLPGLLAIVGEPIPFTRIQAEQAANLFNATGRRRGSNVDCMIAAAALSANAALATNDLNDFRRFQSFGLKLEHP